MKKYLPVILTLLLLTVLLFTAVPAFAGGRGNAPDNAQCPNPADLGSPAAQVTINSDISTNTTSADGDEIRVVNLTVRHGATSSTHDITYEDNDGSESLTCLDTLLGFE